MMRALSRLDIQDKLSSNKTENQNNLSNKNANILTKSQ